ncbi:hypothetical protein P6166_12160 [Stenotrophomonas sp. HITSZ_GD]|uniref:hypothetical protein n=1 Tax=Stenotrophomonas sp. HITSZ_GD TaxID=3037248 RepID=UPI00240DD5B8|nr:hypothetical protein [Stenotrophomonas sp. HITSZ_GD]MDG2526109.1 hypothetical protein [Stenotrophomonas sp. HITSZ_GD]
MSPHQFLLQEQFAMYELTSDQIAEVSGGVLPLFGVLAFVYYERQEISDFFGGVMDGFNGTSHMEP